MNLFPGTMIAGMYRVDRRIGVGGMGEVWAGVRLSDNVGVAIKVLLAHATDANEVQARFRREAQVLVRIRSPYVAQLIDFLTEDDGFILVMELIPGETLHAVLAYDQALTIEATLDIVSDVLHGLRDLHAANIVHRDLKPGNIVLKPRPGQRPRATLIDFGVSRIISAPEDEEEITAITRGDRVLGTLEYMAPEQILGSRTVTGTADLYAVGAMMYRAICGHHVFGDLQEGHLAVAKLNQDAPRMQTGRTDEIAERTQGLVARLLSRRLRDRFKSAEEALVEVASIRSLYLDRNSLPQGELDDEPTFEKPWQRMTEGSARTSAPAVAVDYRAATPLADPGAARPRMVEPEVVQPVASEPANAVSASYATGAPSATVGTSAHLMARPSPIPAPSSQPSFEPTQQPPSVHLHASSSMQPISAARSAAPLGTKPHPRRPKEDNRIRTLFVALVLFMLGSVGGGLFGVSYARGGLAFRILHRDQSGSALPSVSPEVAVPPALSMEPILIEEQRIDSMEASHEQEATDAREESEPEPEPSPVLPHQIPPALSSGTESAEPSAGAVAATSPSGPSSSSRPPTRRPPVVPPKNTAPKPMPTAPPAETKALLPEEP
ncbi:MAG TPA: protein kinase [Polyangiaceae bacterium]|nr:protein kinase [Polyangiaceae bacterium]HNZ23843.1 protein kinase [Polyangiaceae bacterium]HOD22364.1 protein kinase [Polyangiaceae bacterium]HOE50265.1 protein kinase [Polyangiaceae bacterium]HOH01611.1 protein kinase [Polyangiaceae bacterium]